MKRSSSTEDADADTDSASKTEEQSPEAATSNESAGERLLGDPSVASPSGFAAPGGMSDPSVARLPRGDAIGGDVGFVTPGEGTAELQRAPEGDGGDARAGEAGVPDAVRDVISSPGQSLDPSIQRAMEDRMGDSFGDVRVHTGPEAAAACQRLDARAFTVGNHIAFDRGEYDPGSQEGQHVLAHELAHVRQQTGGEDSTLPQDGAELGGMELEVDPDPRLEREAEETAEEAMAEGPVEVNRMPADADVAVQRFLGGEGGMLGLGGDSSGGDDVSLGDDPGVDALAKKVQSLEQRVSKLEGDNSAGANAMGEGVVGTLSYGAGMAASSMIPGGPIISTLLGKGFFGGVAGTLLDKAGVNDKVADFVDSAADTVGDYFDKAKGAASDLIEDERTRKTRFD